ncbi:MAG: hypothetical protein JWM86_1053 [Thermoleophilia bacterium]|nr:hypothetical protein [Thermoleophilia bacterium]
MAKDISIEIGFSGGGSTAVGIPEDALEQLTTALTKEQTERWFTVSSSDGGEFLVDLSSVIFVRVGSRNRTLGFASA